MQNIHVKRFTPEPGCYHGSVEPEDRSWLLLLRDDGVPVLMKRVAFEDDDGTTKHGYLDVELSGSKQL
jgi:hypothetical protein